MARLWLILFKINNKKNFLVCDLSVGDVLEQLALDAEKQAGEEEYHLAQEKGWIDRSGPEEKVYTEVMADASW